MLMPSIFNTNLFDDFFDFPFYDDTKAEKKLYGHHAANLMKTDIQEHDDGYSGDGSSGIQERRNQG